MGAHIMGYMCFRECSGSMAEHEGKEQLWYWKIKGQGWNQRPWMRSG